MSLKFCANLSFMFQESTSLLERYAIAKNAGFSGVECAFPYDIPIQDLVSAKRNADVKQILINAPPGNWAKGDRGLAAVLGRQDEFKDSIHTAVKYAKALDCNRVHVMAGSIKSGCEENLKLYVDNLRFAAKVFEENEIIGLIEPINSYSLPDYYLNCYSKAIEVLKEVSSKHMQLQLDLFHLQHISGNLTNLIKSYLPFVGHIQIAQVPLRHEPDTIGEINYKYVFELLQTLQYSGWIGLEYIPAGKTEDGLSWIKNMGFSL